MVLTVVDQVGCPNLRKQKQKWFISKTKVHSLLYELIPFSSIIPREPIAVIRYFLEITLLKDFSEFDHELVVNPSSTLFVLQVNKLIQIFDT